MPLAIAHDELAMGAEVRAHRSAEPQADRRELIAAVHAGSVQALRYLPARSSGGRAAAAVRAKLRCAP